MLRSNLASVQHVAVPVQAALVDTTTAEEKKTLTFKGRATEYWGFRVDHNGRMQEDTVTYEVETRTMAQIQACHLQMLGCAAGIVLPNYSCLFHRLTKAVGVCHGAVVRCAYMPCHLSTRP